MSLRNSRKKRKRFRRILVDHYGPHCMRCGPGTGNPFCVSALTLDHVTPIREGGQDDLLNIQLLCLKCHKRCDLQRRGGLRPEKRDYRPARDLQTLRDMLEAG